MDRQSIMRRRLEGLYPNFFPPTKMGRETNPEASLIALWSLTHFLKNVRDCLSEVFLAFRLLTVPIQSNAQCHC